MSTPALEIEALNYEYGSGSFALRSVAFEVAEGEIFGLLGPSGAGKTTLQRIMVGLLAGWRGRVAFAGRSIVQWAHRLADHVGVSFEGPSGYPKLTGRENLEHFSRLHDRRPRDFDALLRSVDLLEAADQAYETYSKGMKVRLDLVRALVHDPAFLVLDEPTAGLDPLTSRLVRDLMIAERDSGTTVVLTTHDMTTADAMCDRVAFLIDGAVVDCDSPRGFKERAGVPRLRIEYYEHGRFRAETIDLEGSARRLEELLRSGRVQSVHSTEPTLEDVFVAVTGRRL